MTPKENLLHAIRHDAPEWVPRASEGVFAGVAYEGNFRVASWVDAWGVRWETTRDDMVPFPKGNPLPDLDRLDDFAFPDPDAMFVLSEDTRAYLDALDRDACILLGQQVYFLFERAWALMGMEGFMMAFHTHPAELRELLRRITDYNVRIFDRYMEAGCDGVGFSEDLGSQRALLISPAAWREFLLPEYARAFAPVRAAGGMVNFHSCGCVMDIAEDLADLGVEILNPVQARANDLAELKRRVGGRMALMGAIDTQHVLMRGTPADVEAEVRRVLDILAPGGGYICGPDQGMPFPEENIAALWRACEEHGRYA
jgi:uroporphyrinogen decarboxylase